jgi:hypothetical protein
VIVLRNGSLESDEVMDGALKNRFSDLMKEFEGSTLVSFALLFVPPGETTTTRCHLLNRN